MKKYIFILAIFSAVLAGCYYDKTDEIYPGRGLFTPCDTTHAVSYQTHIVPVLQNFCYSCHSGSTPSSGFNLDSYASVYQQYANGNLAGDLAGAQGYRQMPPTYTLDSCYINQLTYWINNGAPNN